MTKGVERVVADSIKATLRNPKESAFMLEFAAASKAASKKRADLKASGEHLLAFAAGAMMYVVVEELIPEMSEGEHSNLGTIAFSLGFVLMMILDVALG